MASNGPSKSHPLTLHAAAGNGDFDFLKQQIEGGEPVDSRVPDGETPLFSATRYNRLPIVIWLLQNNADVNARSNNGKSPLHIAALYNFVDLIYIFSVFHAQMDPVDADGMTPLCLSVKNNSLETTSLLLSLTADPNHNGPPLTLTMVDPNHNGNPLILAMKSADFSVTTTLHEKYSIVEVLTAYGALLPASYPCSKEMQSALGLGLNRWWETTRWMERAERTLDIFFPKELTSSILEYTPDYLPLKKTRERQQKKEIEAKKQAESGKVLADFFQKLSIG